MRVYLAGPMRGYPRYNFDAFTDAATRLRSLGYEVLSPAENDIAAGFDPDGPLESLDLYAAFRWDVEAVLACDQVVLLPHWHQSEGASLEFALARAIGTPATDLAHILARHEPTTTGAAQ